MKIYNIKDFIKEFKIYNTVEFKKLDNFDNYFIYEDGRIFSFKLKRFLKPKDNGHGYKIVELRNNGEKKICYIHRLIYEVFKGPIQKGLEIDHANGIRSDNRLNNLRLLTPKENKNNKHHLEIYKEIDANCYLKNKEYSKNYYKEKRQQIREKYKEYYYSNKDKINKHKKDYYDLNKEKIKEKIKKYNELNKDKIKEQKKQYYEQNKEEINRRRREKYRLNKMNKIN